MIFLTKEQLAERGYDKSDPQKYRDERDGLFPKSVRVGNGNRTVESEFLVYQQIALARRDYPHLADKIAAWLRAEKKAGRNAFTLEKLSGLLAQHGVKQ